MGAIIARVSRVTTAAALAAVLTIPQIGFTQAVNEEPTAMKMVGDLVVARPLLLVMTALGTATYAVSLPFTLAGGNAKEAGEVLVVGPAKTTFVRCLGCAKPGYKQEAAYEKE